MFGLLDDLLVASSINSMPFKMAFKRVRCIRSGHSFVGAKIVDQIYSENHPHTNDQVRFTVVTRECACGVLFYEHAVESRTFKGRNT